ncbi:MAG: methyltransferase domain-containing protein [Pirellulales bacterium]
MPLLDLLDHPATESSATGVSRAADSLEDSRVVVLADGSPLSLAGLSTEELLRIQFEQEQAYARRFVESPKRSPERAAAFAAGYDTVTALFAAANGMTGVVAMGIDPRYERLVAGLLAGQRRRGITPRLFEVGYGCGTLLDRMSRRGYDIGGIEVSPAMHRQAYDTIAAEHRDKLLLGDFMADNAPLDFGGYTLCYWNDVFEHIAPDEIGDYLARIYDLLAPGGLLVTITPNWHVRPNDVTGDYFPPRTEARGVHLKEYTLGEVTSLLRRAGFRHVATPLFVTPRRIVRCGDGMAAIKRGCEPWLERLPFRLAKLLVRGFGLSTTIARRP